jgi:hypothetical protein
MALSFANLTAGTGTSDPQATASVTATSGRVLFLTVAVSTSGAPYPVDDIAISGLGATWTKVGTALYATRRRIWLYVGTGGSGTGTVSINPEAGPAYQEVGWVLDEASDVDTTTPTFGFTVVADDAAYTSRVATATGTAGPGDGTYTGLALESNIDCSPEAGFTGLGATTTGSLGVRRVETAWDDAADMSGTWTWDGSGQGCATFTVGVNVGTVPPTPVSYVNNALGGTTTTTSFSITLPTTAADDIIVLEYTHRGTGDATLGGTYSGPAFTEKHDQQYATSTFSGKTLWSRATGNHSGQTVTGSGLTNSCAAIVTVYRDALTSGDPLVDATIVGEQNASGNATQAEITTASDGAMVVLVVANSPDLAISAQACTSPGALTERAEVLSTGGTDTSIAHASAVKTTAGATGAFTWTQTAAANGSWAYAIKPQSAASTTKQGEATGTIGWAGAVTGTRTSRGAATGAVGWVGGATGRRISAGAATGAVDRAGSATGREPAGGTATGSVAWAGAATGARTSSGATTGTVAWSGSATGTRTSRGAATGAVDWVGSATGEQPTVGANTGEATGSISWAGSVTGEAPTVAASEGEATGTVTWAGSATGARTPKGSTSGSVAWVGEATGEAPAIGVQDGSATGTITWTGSATGTRPSSGSASGTVSWSGGATGTRTSRGAATGTVTWTGTATGEAPTVGVNDGAATGTITWVGTATGDRTSAGAAAGAITWDGVANGWITVFATFDGTRTTSRADTPYTTLRVDNEHTTTRIDQPLTTTPI